MLSFTESLRCCSSIIYAPTKRALRSSPAATVSPRKKKRLPLLILFVYFAVPVPSFAAVILSEIAWMGTNAQNGQYCEWIELHNTGESAVDLTGWAIQIGDGAIRAFDGGETDSRNIAPGAYYVIERLIDTSCPDPVPNVRDMRLTFGNIPNSNTSVALLRADGAIEDVVSTNEELWADIGGNNETKDTAQYTGSGWITGVPTPGAENTTIASTPEGELADEVEEQSTDTTTTETKRGSTKKQPNTKETVTVRLPDPELALSFELPKTAYVNQPITFRVSPEGISDRLLASVSIDWNFGNLVTASGREVRHAYAYPGEYVVTIRGSFARHEAFARHTITILPVTLALVRTELGDVRIHNNARYELDLSGYTLRGGRTLTFPPRTILLPQATLTIPSEKLGSVAPILYDQRGMIVARIEALRAEPMPEGMVRGAETTHLPVALSVTEPVETDPDFSFASDAPHTTESSAASTTLPAVLTSADPTPAPEPTVPAQAWPYLGLLGVVAVGIAAIFAGNAREKTGKKE